jgi:hypothetical protein
LPDFPAKICNVLTIPQPKGANLHPFARIRAGRTVPIGFVNQPDFPLKTIGLLAAVYIKI